MGEFFNLDNKFFQGINKVVDCFGISVLWTICCIPLAFTAYAAFLSASIVMFLPCIITAIPAGAATTALYYTVNKVIRHGRGYVWKEFWHSFGTNFKQSAFITMILTALAIVFGGDGYVMYQYAKAGEKSGALYMVFIVLMVVEVCWVIYVFPYLARFENGNKAVLKNSGFIAIGNLPKTLLLLVVLAFMCFAVYIFPVIVIIVPAIYMVIANFILEKVFRKYMSEEDIEAEEERNRDFLN